MAIKATAEKVINFALGEVGYLEKRSNSQLDSKTANAGSKNYTKYARDLNEFPGLLNGNKQGYAWCAVFVVWLYVMAFGVEIAKKLLNLPKNSLAASCTALANYFKEKGQFHTKDPKRGDVIFFKGSDGTPSHTGIVYKVDNLYVYTIEGNTSTQAGVIANGGGVFKKSYALSYNRIYGYGRPDYDEVPEENAEPEVNTEPEKTNKGDFTVGMLVLREGDKGDAVRALQILLIGNGFSCGKWGADGKFGLGTKGAVMDYQEKNGLQYDGQAGPETFKSLLGVK